MKKTVLIIAAAISAMPVFAQSEDPGRGGEKAAAAAPDIAGLDLQTRIQLMKQFDRDGDGRLNEEERAEAMKALREKTADLAEMRRKFAREIIAKFDKDGDGKLSREERRAMFEEARKKREELFKKYDIDGDGKLSDAEKTKLIQDPEVQNMMKRMIGNPPRFGE